MNMAEPGRIAEVRGMSVEDICSHLDVLKLSQYKIAFREYEIDGDLLLDLTTDDLVHDLGFNNIQAKKLQKCITQGWLPKP